MKVTANDLHKNKTKKTSYTSFYNEGKKFLSDFISRMCTLDNVRLAINSKKDQEIRSKFVLFVSHEIKEIDHIDTDSIDMDAIDERIDKLVTNLKYNENDKKDFITFVSELISDQRSHNDLEEFIENHFPKEEIENGKKEENNMIEEKKETSLTTEEEIGNNTIEEKKESSSTTEEKIENTVEEEIEEEIEKENSDEEYIDPKEDEFLDTVDKIKNIIKKEYDPQQVKDHAIWKYEAWKEEYTIEDFKSDISKLYPKSESQALDFLIFLLPRCIARVDLGTDIKVFVKTKLRTKEEKWSTFRKHYPEKERANQFTISQFSSEIGAKYVWKYSLWDRYQNIVFNEVDLPFIKSITSKRKTKTTKPSIPLPKNEIGEFLTKLKSNEWKLKKEYIITSPKHGFIIVKSDFYKEFIEFCKKNTILNIPNDVWFGRKLKNILNDCKTNDGVRYYMLPLEYIHHE